MTHLELMPSFPNDLAERYVLMNLGYLGFVPVFNSRQYKQKTGCLKKRGYEPKSL